MKTNREILSLIYAVSPTLEYESNDGIVTILERQDHKIQQLFRRLKVRIPQYKKIELDPYASFVFLHIDGKNTVERIGGLLDERYGEDAHPLYERLLLFMNYLDATAGYIRKLDV